MLNDFYQALNAKWLIELWVFLTVWCACLIIFFTRSFFSYAKFRQLIAKRLSWSTRERIATQLKRAGLYQWEVADWVIVRESITMMTVMFSYLITQQWLIVLMSVVVIRVWFDMFLVTKIKNQRHQLSLDLPYFLDLLCMTLTSGMNLQTGIQTSLHHMQQGSLKLVWHQYVFDIRSGVTYELALQKLMTHTGHDEIRKVCVSLIQAQQRGMSVANMLSEHARQMRASHLLAAEKRALQAPVRMLFPLVICFFPCTFLVLGYAIWVSTGLSM